MLFSIEQTGSLRWIHPVCAASLALFNGKRTDNEVMEAFSDQFSVEPDRARELIERMLGNFGDTLETFADPVNRRCRYQPADLIFEPSGQAGTKRLSSPIEIAWLVTERCHCDCCYCCIKTQPASSLSSDQPAAELTTEQALAFLDDCASAGVQKVLLHGGEPFLRADIPEIVAHLLSHDIFLTLSTKLRLSEQVVRRLADAGLEELQVSVDTDDPGLADSLVGIEQYLGRTAFWNIELLQRYGIMPRVNTVVLDANVGHIARLIRTLAERGVTRVTLSGYLRSAWKHDDRHFAGAAAINAMAEQVSKVASELGVSVDLPPLASPRELSLAEKSFSSCSGGATGLVVGADGRASICDRLLPYPEAIVGNVTRSSLMEIWQSEALRAFVFPGEEAFAGTACAGCQLREACDRRIRCYNRAKMITGQLFGPDYLCDKLPPPATRYF